jgi:hypothetical protein
MAGLRRDEIGGLVNIGDSRFGRRAGASGTRAGGGPALRWRARGLSEITEKPKQLYANASH